MALSRSTVNASDNQQAFGLACVIGELAIPWNRGGGWPGGQLLADLEFVPGTD